MRGGSELRENQNWFVAKNEFCCANHKDAPSKGKAVCV
jgi:hypothetical protein